MVAAWLSAERGPSGQMALLPWVGNGGELRCRAVAEVTTAPVLGQKGKGPPPAQLPSAQPPALEEARSVPLHLQGEEAFSFQSLKRPALGNRSTARLENILPGNMLNSSMVHCCLLRFKQILYKCGFFAFLVYW